ncbi:MAG: type II toxin-antitoxin system prevent-host-death family antitoxin [Terracidiphilus sp.]|jgi:prevent-host-death family protein
MSRAPKTNPNSAPTLTTRASLDEVLRRVKSGNGRAVIKRHGRSEAVVLSVEKYFDLIAPPPEWLKECWKASKEAGLDKMTMEEIDAIIAEVRSEQREREEASVCAA